MGLRSDLESKTAEIYAEAWSRRDGRVVPEDSALTFANDGIDIDVTILYTDLSSSTKLADNYRKDFAAENYKVFLHGASRIIRSEGGHIRSFDGDRVMGVFIGDAKNSTAVRCGLKINWFVKNIARKKMAAQYPTTNYVMDHVTGIDTGKILAVRSGIRGSNDIVWVGRPANHAAKLCSLPAGFPTRITKPVYDSLSNASKYSDSVNMWERARWTDMYDKPIYRSTYWWSI